MSMTKVEEQWQTVLRVRLGPYTTGPWMQG